MDKTDQEALDRDPVTGLSAKDRDAIRCSWAVINKDLQAAGSAFMLRFFREYPTNQKYFKEFRQLSLEELQSTPGLSEHAMRVMNALASIVDSIDEAHVLVAVVHKTVDSHVSRGIRAKQFTELIGVFTRFLADSLGDQFTPDMGTAWQTATATITAVVEARVQEKLIVSDKSS